MSRVPDAWEDEWSSTADKTSSPPLATADSTSAVGKKTTTKVTKAQKRAQQAEFNRQLWAEAEGPRETNYFLESRNVVPHRSEFKPPPILLSRKGPVIQSRPQTNKPTGNSSQSQPPTTAFNNLTLASRRNPVESSDEDEDDDPMRKQQTMAERQAQTLKEREEKQRKYDERRMELFGTPTATANSSGPGVNAASTNSTNTKSGTSSPSSLTPPGSRSSTPNSRGRGRGRRGGGGGGGGNAAGNGNVIHQQPKSHPQQTNLMPSSQLHQQHQPYQPPQLQQLPQQPKQQYPPTQQQKDLFDPSYAPKPDSIFLSRRNENSPRNPGAIGEEVRPVRAPKGPDGSGRGGYGFSSVRGGRMAGFARRNSTITTDMTAPGLSQVGVDAD